MAVVPSRRGPRSEPNSLLAVIWKRYLRELHDNPVQTKALSAAVIFAVSDAVAQALNRSGPYSFRRGLVVAAWGLIWGGPSAHYWQNLMEYLTKGRKDLPSVLVKVLIDQSTYGPLNNLATLAFLTLIVEDKGVAHFKHKLYHDYPSIQLNGWKLWPAAAMFNYRFVPLPMRVLFLNCVALFWTTFLNVQATRKKLD